MAKILILPFKTAELSVPDNAPPVVSITANPLVGSIVVLPLFNVSKFEFPTKILLVIKVFPTTIFETLLTLPTFKFPETFVVVENN